MAYRAGTRKGSSADLSSAASSEFEEVGLEELGLHPGEEVDWTPGKKPSIHGLSKAAFGGIVGKTTAAPPPTASHSAEAADQGTSQAAAGFAPTASDSGVVHFL